MTHPLDERRLAALPVDAGLAALLDELLATATPAVARPRRRWPLVVAAAASVAVVAAVPAYLAQRDGGAAPTTPAATSALTGSPSGTPTEVTDAPSPPDPNEPPAPVVVTVAPWTAPGSYALLDLPGWAFDRNGVTGGAGQQVVYSRGGETLELSVTPRRWYASQVTGAVEEAEASTLEVLGEQATYVEYESEQQMAFLPVHDGFGLRVAAGFTTPATFQALVGGLRKVDEAGFAAALPPDTVAPRDAERVANGMVRGSEVAPGTRVRVPGGYNSRYHVAAAVVDAIGCAWLDRWAVGDPAARRDALRALTGSRTWAPVTDDLRQPDWFVETLQRMRAGAPASEVYATTICGRAPTPAGDPAPPAP